MGSEWYSVHMEARASADALNLTVDEDAADAFMDLLEDHDGAVSTGTGVWEATISVRAINAWEATSSGSVLIEKLADKAGMPDWPAVRVDVVRQDVLEAEEHAPDPAGAGFRSRGGRNPGSISAAPPAAR